MSEKNNVSPTLIIGLGGTGSLALQYAKRKIRNRLESIKTAPLPPQIPFIEYVMLDTILTEDQLEEFVPDEFMDIGRVNISRALDSLRSASDERILNWFPRHLDPGQIDSGAGGVRAIGRLCFFLKESEIEDRIKGKVTKITSSDNIRNALNEYLSTLQFVEGGAIDVHFVSSLCGGTGSACLLDTAYLVQKIILDEMKQMPNCVAHLITTEPFVNAAGIGRSSREYIQRNFALSLSEIEHFISKGSWDVEYRNGTRVSADRKPFSLAYLLGYKDGVSLKRTQICEIIGETIAINCVHPDGKRIKGDIENHKPHVINTEDSRQKLRTYSSYNTQILRTDVDEQMLNVGVLVAQRMIISSLCAESTEEAANQAFEHFAQHIFVEATEIRSLDFPNLEHHVKSRLDIRVESFDAAAETVKNTLRESPRKRRKSSEAASLQVIQASNSVNQIIRANQGMLIGSLKRVFTGLSGLTDRTDQEINELISRQGLNHVSRLLARISQRFFEIQNDLKARTKSASDRKFTEEITREIIEGRSGAIAQICKERAEANTLDRAFDELLIQISTFKRNIDERKIWCDNARSFLKKIGDRLPEPEPPGRPSHTTNSVWTLADLTREINSNRETFVEDFIKLLEHEYEQSDLNRSVRFLPYLSDSAGHPKTIKRLLEKVSRERTDDQIEHQQSKMQQKAAEKMHEFVDLASPAWQIEKTGEDIAAVSITNCPENSPSGQIMSSFGKNISFSRNGVSPRDQREIVLFRSEHGASVNHLSNFKKCLDAVARKMHTEGQEKIGDLCLDPGWNVAAPLPLRIEDLRLEFSLAIHFGLISSGFEYKFKNAIGADVKLRQNPDENKATRRFEAFGKLVDLDCINDVDCNYLRTQVQQKMTQGTDNQKILVFRTELSQHLDNVDRLIAKYEKHDPQDKQPLSAPEETQLKKEHTALAGYIAQLDRSIEAMEDNRHGPSD